MLQEACSPSGPPANVVVIDPRRREISIAAEWSGALPFYVKHDETSFHCSSHLRPLARAAGAEPDLLAVLEFLRYGYTIGPRTWFLGISRLHPGEVIRLRPGHPPRHSDTSDLWSGESETSSADAVNLVVELLREGLVADDGGRSGIMMSGGWDSRTLLGIAARFGTRERLLCYAHGDQESRELRLARQAATIMEVGFHGEPVQVSAFEPETLARGFDESETALFPHWAHAGRMLRSLGATTLVSGVFGEVLGGRYSRAVLEEGWRKMLAVGAGLARQQPSASRRTVDEWTRRVLVPRAVNKPWCLDAAAWTAITGPGNRILADAAAVLDRLVARGVTTDHGLAEAFVTEHRGARYSAAQALSGMGEVALVLPFADRALLRAATRLPLALKIHNSLNRELLRQVAPALLSLPMAATLVRADRPIVFQEGSRLVRKILEQTQWRMHFATGRRTSAPSFAWANFEPLRSTGVLGRIVDDLRSPLWDAAAMRRAAGRLAADPRGPIHPAADMFLRVYTMDLMFR